MGIGLSISTCLSKMHYYYRISAGRTRARIYLHLNEFFSYSTQTNIIACTARGANYFWATSCLKSLPGSPPSLHTPLEMGNGASLAPSLARSDDKMSMKIKSHGREGTVVSFGSTDASSIAQVQQSRAGRMIDRQRLAALAPPPSASAPVRFLMLCPKHILNPSESEVS